MAKWWRTAENWVNRVGIWFTGFVALSAIFGWIASHLVFLKPYGWAEAAIAGTAIAALVALALSATLSAWRYFQPLHGVYSPQKPPPKSEDFDTFRAQISDQQAHFSNRIVQMGEGFKSTTQRLSEEIADIYRQIRVEAPNASTVYEAYKNLEDASLSQIKQIREETQQFSNKLNADNLDLKHLLYLSLLQTAEQILSYLLSIAPRPHSDENAALDFDEFQLTSNFLEEAARLFAGTQRASELRNVLRHAEDETDFRLKERPLDQWPTQLNLVDLRRYSIAATQRKMLIEYLERQLREVQKNTRGMRDTLLERHQERTKR